MGDPLRKARLDQLPIDFDRGPDSASDRSGAAPDRHEAATDSQDSAPDPQGAAPDPQGAAPDPLPGAPAPLADDWVAEETSEPDWDEVDAAFRAAAGDFHADAVGPGGATTWDDVTGWDAPGTGTEPSWEDIPSWDATVDGAPDLPAYMAGEGAAEPTGGEAAASAEMGTPEKADELDSPRGRGPRGSRRRGVAVGALGIVVAAAFLGPKLNGMISSTATDGGAPAGVSTAYAAEAVPEATAIRPTDPPARFSVALASYEDPATAAERLAFLVRRAPDMLFVLVPVEIEGRVFGRLLAGAATETGAAVRLKVELATLLEESSASWLVREAGLAFDLGRYPTPGEASDRAAALRADGIDAYVLASDMTDGSVEHRVYAGGFATRPEATHLAAVLASAGYDADALVARFGTHGR